ncbi:nucleophile aminohydrolase [Mycena rosella]|uniref:Nucleophile aminohydrolase n=1 Tax=Mycena rosella TaxID=1033263 RepID=A0AAD7D252_MYCRO|nr:nucleophile aminohydrolase [Mycena rosella]
MYQLGSNLTSMVFWSFSCIQASRLQKVLMAAAAVEYGTRPRSRVHDKDSMADKSTPAARVSGNANYVLVCHGGAGTMSRKGSTPEQRAAYKAGIRAALEAGYKLLSEGGEAMDAVTAAVSSMEDNPLFNAERTRGLVDALQAPGVAPCIPSSRRGIGMTLLTHVRNPSALARALYLAPDLLPHAFISGATAECLAESLGEELVDESYFYTQARWVEHRRGLGLPDGPFPYPNPDDEKAGTPLLDLQPTGTVGAVALDVRGCIAALTSTGGRTNKLVGRVGDTPHMGAGFWAEEWPAAAGWVQKAWGKIWGLPAQHAVGVSGTGDGDYFIRCATGVTIAHRVKYLGESLEKATEYAVEELRQYGGIAA